LQKEKIVSQQSEQRFSVRSFGCALFILKGELRE